MIRDEQVYIAWHSGIAVSTTGVFGTASVNTDDRLWNDAGGPFFLSFYEKGNTVNYAVSDADAEEFISRVLKQSEADLAEGAAPSPPAFGIGRIPDRVGTEIRVGMKVFPFRDAALMKSWLGELRLKCGEPLSAAEFYRASHPAPVPPEGAVEVTKIVEQQVLPYRPPAALGPGPDNCRSELLAEGGFAVLSVFQNGMHLEYVLPPELLPEVNAAAGGLLAGQLDAPRKEGDEDAWVKFRGREEEFDALPEAVLELFQSLVGRCGDPIPRKERMDFYKVYLPSVRERLDGAWDCPLCEWKRNTGDYCQGCGAKKEDIPSGRAVSEPKPRAETPWRCNCGAEGNVGGWCAICGRPYDYPPLTGRTVFGYRRGVNMFTAFGMMGLGAMAPALASPPKPGPPAPLGPGEWFCTACGARNRGKFCTECGKEKNS